MRRDTDNATVSVAPCRHRDLCDGASDILNQEGVPSPMVLRRTGTGATPVRGRASDPIPLVCREDDTIGSRTSATTSSVAGGTSSSSVVAGCKAIRRSHSGKSSTARIRRGSIGEVSGSGTTRGWTAACWRPRQAGGRRSQSGMPVSSPPSGIGGKGSGSAFPDSGGRLAVTGTHVPLRLPRSDHRSSSLAIQMVTGPSLIRWTAISAPNTPRSTRKPASASAVANVSISAAA